MTNKNDDKTKEKVDQVEEVESLEVEKVTQLENLLKRALADYQNLEKRVLEEKRSWIQQANKQLLLRLLPSLDTLDLALDHLQDKGVKMAVGQMLDALKQEGIQKIETKDKEFDPYRMECVQTIEGEDNKVLDELRSGYTLFDKVLRPAQVVVGKGK